MRRYIHVRPHLIGSDISTRNARRYGAPLLYYAGHNHNSYGPEIDLEKDGLVIGVVTVEPFQGFDAGDFQCRVH